LLRSPSSVPVQILAEVVDEDAERGLLPRGQGGFGQVEGLVLAIGRRRTEVAAVGPDLEERGLLTMRGLPGPPVGLQRDLPLLARRDRKSTRLNSSHVSSSYAAFCLTKT